MLPQCPPENVFSGAPSMQTGLDPCVDDAFPRQCIQHKLAMAPGSRSRSASLKPAIVEERSASRGTSPGPRHRRRGLRVAPRVQVPTILGRRAADDDAAMERQSIEDRVQGATPGIIEEEVDAVGAGDVEVPEERARLVVDGRVAAQPYEKLALDGAAGDADDAAARRLQELDGDRPDAAGRRRDDRSPALGGLRTLKQPTYAARPVANESKLRLRPGDAGMLSTCVNPPSLMLIGPTACDDAVTMPRTRLPMCD